MNNVIVHLWEYSEAEKALLTFLVCIGRELCHSMGAFSWLPVENTVKKCLYRIFDVFKQMSMHFTYLLALEMGEQLRNMMLNNCKHNRPGYNNINGKSRLAQAHKLLNNLISSTRILGKDARVARPGEHMSILNIAACGL